MLYKEPFVLYLNISVCIILLFLALPSLLNRKEGLKVRLAFFLIFFIVISTCLINLLVLFTENYRLVYLGWINFVLPLSFGPAIYFYVKNLLGSRVSKKILFSQLPGLVALSYGLYLAFADPDVQQKEYQQIIDGDQILYEIINNLTLILTLFYCIKTWLFIKEFKSKHNNSMPMPYKLKIAWAREFIIYMFANVFIFLVLVLILTNGFEVTTMDMDLIGMPAFMLVVYLLIAMRSMMMYKEFEHQYVLAKIESDKQIQDQRLEIARDLHDSLGAQLTFIASVSDGIKRNAGNQNDQLKAKADTLADFTENAIAELKNALWILNADEVRLEDLKSKLLNFITAAGEAKEELQFHFQFNITENLAVQSKWAVNLFRIVQEIINNAAKYSQAKDVWIDINQSGSTLLLKIHDNGIGFDINETKNTSFGFANLRQRISEMEGKIEINSVKNQGTSYLIEITLK